MAQVRHLRKYMKEFRSVVQEGDVVLLLAWAVEGPQWVWGLYPHLQGF